MPTRKPKGNVQGEGDYTSGRRFQEEERAFVRSGQVERNAREAADALKGPEGPELERARMVSARGRSLPRRARDGARKPKPQGPVTADPGVDAALDHGLEETFPASDPVSISPGGD